MLLWKESVNIDGQHFHQNQQSEQSPLILTDWTQNKTTTYYEIRNPGPGLYSFF
jgi:hypothetical protein